VGRGDGDNAMFSRPVTEGWLCLCWLKARLGMAEGLQFVGLFGGCPDAAAAAFSFSVGCHRLVSLSSIHISFHLRFVFFICVSSLAKKI